MDKPSKPNKAKAKTKIEKELKSLEDEVWNKKVEIPGRAIQANMDELKKQIKELS